MRRFKRMFQSILTNSSALAKRAGTATTVHSCRAGPIGAGVERNRSRTRHSGRATDTTFAGPLKFHSVFRLGSSRFACRARSYHRREIWTSGRVGRAESLARRCDSAIQLRTPEGRASDSIVVGRVASSSLRAVSKYSIHSAKGEILETEGFADAGGAGLEDQPTDCHAGCPEPRQGETDASPSVDYWSRGQIPVERY